MGLASIVQEARLKEEPQVAPSKRPERWLQPRIMSHLVSTREIHVKKDMWLSPSVIADFCPRAWVIAHRLDIPLIDEIGPDNRWWMDGGTAHHTMLQEWWLGPAKIIKGGWECPKCLRVVGYDPLDDFEVYSHGEHLRTKVTTESAVFCPDKCPNCGYTGGWRSPFRYIEPMVYDKELKIVGLMDGIIDWGKLEDEIWDLKTKAGSESIEWVVEAPDISHVKQLMWYLDMAKKMFGRIVYIDRGAKYLVDAFVEHQVDFDEVLMEKEKEKVRAFRKATEDPESSIPACPDGGQTRFGPCQCRELEVAWKSYGARP